MSFNFKEFRKEAIRKGYITNKQYEELAHLPNIISRYFLNFDEKSLPDQIYPLNLRDSLSKVPRASLIVALNTNIKNLRTQLKTMVYLNRIDLKENIYAPEFNYYLIILKIHEIFERINMPMRIFSGTDSEKTYQRILEEIKKNQKSEKTRKDYTPPLNIPEPKREWLLFRNYEKKKPESNLDYRINYNVGFINPTGTACYHNSVLKAFYHLEYFNQYILTEKSLLEQSPFFLEYFQLLNTMQKAPRQKPININSIFNRTCLMMGASKNRQQDAHEFVTAFLKEIDQVRYNKNNISFKTGDTMLSMFETVTQSEYLDRFNKCQIKHPHFVDNPSLTIELALTITNNGGINQSSINKEGIDLNKYLEAHFQDYIDIRCYQNQEKHSDYWINKVRSAKIKEPFERKIRIITPPKYIILMLKRNVAGFYNDTLIKYPEFLDMSPYLLHKEERASRYRLLAVVNHMGSITALRPEGYGHYTCYAYNSNLRKWFLHNDQSVIEVVRTNDIFNDNKNAYILFYERQQIPNIRVLTFCHDVSTINHQLKNYCRTILQNYRYDGDNFGKTTYQFENVNQQSFNFGYDTLLSSMKEDYDFIFLNRCNLSGGRDSNLTELSLKQISLCLKNRGYLIVLDQNNEIAVSQNLSYYDFEDSRSKNIDEMETPLVRIHQTKLIFQKIPESYYQKPYINLKQHQDEYFHANL